MSDRSLLHSSESAELEKAGDTLMYDALDSPSRRRSLEKKRLAIQIYIAIVVTIACATQFLNTWSPTCPVGGNELDTDNGYIEYAYSRDLRYMSLDHNFDDLWKYGNMSTLRVPEPVLEASDDVPASISMFHQLHCLSSFRTALQDAYEGRQVAYDWHDNGHWPHCLDYLRNTILCFADDTLELPQIINGKRTRVIDGAQDIRKCKSNKMLFELQKSHENGN